MIACPRKEVEGPPQDSKLKPRRRRHGVHSRRCLLPSSSASLRLRPDPGLFTGTEEVDVDDVGVAADGAVLDVLLFVAGRRVEGDHDRLAARRADIAALRIGGRPPSPSPAPLPPLPTTLLSFTA